MKIGIGTRGWTAIDCGEEPSLCAVSVRTAVPAGHRPLVLACAELPGRPDDDASSTLHELLGRMDRRLPLLMTLARSQYRLQILAEPPVPQREIEASLRWSLNAANDAPSKNLNLAWFRIPTEEQLPNRPKQVYAVSVPRSSLDGLLGGWRRGGASPAVVDIRETALRNVAAALERPGEGLALVCRDSGGVGMVFIHQGALFLDRYIEQPMAEVQAADPAMRARLHERIAQQVVRSIDVIARNYPFMPVTRVVVAPSPEAPGLQECLAEQLPVPVEPLDLSQVFDLSRVPELAGSATLQGRCLVALGAALRSAKGGA